MSVPLGKRRESEMNFLKNARDIEVLLITLRINKPKRYTFFFDKLLDYVFNLLSNVKAANSIYPENQIELGMRIRLFKQGLADCEVLVSQIEVVYKTLKDDGVAIGQVKELAQLLRDEKKSTKKQKKIKRRRRSMDKEVAMALGRICEQINELGRRIDNLYAMKNKERKAEITENESAILDEADTIDENNSAILDLADYIADIEDRISELEANNG